MNDNFTIEQIVTWYKNLPRAFNDLETLVSARRALSCRYYELSGMVGRAKALYGEKQHTSKSKLIIRRQELIAEGKNATLAKALAESDTIQFELDEFTAYSDLQEVLLQYEGVKEVLSSMQQHISYLKDERRSEFSGTGSQEA